MRLAIIAAAAPADRGKPPVIGERDAELINDRLALADLGFDVVLLDPAIDLAEQIDEVLTAMEAELEEVLLYASCLSAVVDGEAYLCLDPSEPDVGDALRELVDLIAHRADRAALMVLDVRCQDPNAGHSMVRATTDAIQACVNTGATGVELIAAARPLGAHGEQIPSRMTVGILEAIDTRRGGINAKEAYARAIQSTNLGSWPTAVAYTPTKTSLVLRPDDAPRISEEFFVAPRSDAASSNEEAPRISEEISVDLDADSPIPSDEAPPISNEISVDVGPDSSGGTDAAPRISEEISVDLESDTPGPSDEGPVSDDPPADLEGEAPPLSEPVPSSQPKHGPRSGELLSGFSPDDSLPRPIEPPLPPEAQPSERAESTTTVTRTSGEAVGRKTPLPKVMLGGHLPAKKPGDPDETQPSYRVDSNLANQKLRAAKAKTASARGAGVPSPKPSSSRSGRKGSAKEAPADSAGASAAEEADSPAAPPVEEPPSMSPAAKARKAKRPSEFTVDDHIAAGDEAVSVGKGDAALACFKKALGKLGTASTPQRAEIYIRIGKLTRERGKVRVAISNFDKALAITPENAEALEAVVELHVMQKNWRAVAAAEDKLLATLDETAPERLELLLAFGQRWNQQGKNRKRAKQRFEDARDSFPKEAAPLEQLLGIYEEDQQVEHVLDVRRRLATLVSEPRQRGQLYLDLGRYCLELGRDDEGLASLELAIDSDPSLIEALEALAEYLGESQEWGELERVYTKAIDSFASRECSRAETSVVAELYHRQAMLYRDHLEDSESALRALDGALKLRPKQLATQLLAAEVAGDLEDPGRALKYLRASSNLKPRRASIYHSMFSLGQQHDEVETSFLSSSVATVLGEADEREAIVYREHRVASVPTHKRPLKPEAWQWLRCSKEVSPVDRVMRAISPAVLRLRVSQLRDAKRLPDLPEDGRQDIESSTVSAVRSIVWACQYLGFGDVPSIYISDKFKGMLRAPFAPHQSILLGRGLLSGRSLGELAFLIGRHLARRIPEHELVAHMQSVDELSACFLAGLKMILGTSPASGKLAKTADGLAASLAIHQTAEERAELKSAVEEFSNAGGRVDLKNWIVSVEHCASRAGYVLCGDLQTAVNLLRTEKLGIRSADVESHVDDLYAFAVSGFNIKLRRALGCYIH